MGNRATGGAPDAPILGVSDQFRATKLALWQADDNGWPNDQSIERILSTVDKVPDSLDRKALRSDLVSANQMIMAAMARRLYPRTRRQVQRIYKTARKLQQLIGRSSRHRGAVDDIVADLDKLSKSEKANARFESFLKEMTQVGATNLSDSANSQREMTQTRGILDGLATLAPKPKHTLGPHDLSASEWLAGVHFPEVFERHFNDKAGYSCDAYSDGDKVRGRYVDFAEAVFRELGVSYTRKAIANALTLARSGNSRRRRATR